MPFIVSNLPLWHRARAPLPCRLGAHRARCGAWIVALSITALTALGLHPGPADAQGRTLNLSSPELKALVATPVGAQPADEMRWSIVMVDLGRPNDALRLREWLLGLWLRQQAGEALPPPWPMEQVLTAPAREVVPTFDRAAQQVWQQAFNRHLVARLPAAAVPVPAEIEAVGEQLETLGPGVWLRRDRAGAPRTFYAWVELAGRGGPGFPATGFTVPLPGGTLECALPRGGAPRLVAPGDATGLLCAKALGAAPVVTGPGAAPRPVTTPAGTSTATPPAGASTTLAALPGWTTPDALARDLAAASQAGALQPEPLWREGVRSGVAYALAEARRDEAQAWVQRYRQANAERAAQERAESRARERTRERRQQWKARLIAVAVLAGVIGAFALLARRFGPRSAAWMLWGLGMLVCVPLAVVTFTSARGSGGWAGLAAFIAGAALLAAPTVVAASLYAAYVLVRDFVRDERFRRLVVWGMLALTVMAAVQVLIGRFL